MLNKLYANISTLGAKGLDKLRKSEYLRGARGKSKAFLIAITVFMLEMLWYVPAGSRESIVFTLAALVLAYIFINRTVPKKTITFLLVADVPLLAILGAYRYVAVDTRIRCQKLI